MCLLVVGRLPSNSFIHQKKKKKKTKIKKGEVPSQRKELVSPEVAMTVAKDRVAKLQAVLETLGEDDEMYHTIRAELKKAEVRAQERPVTDQSTKLFVERKRVEQARVATIKAREVLEAAIAGEQRLTELTKEKAIPSPFTVDVSAVSPDIQAEFSRMKDTI